MYKLLMIAAGGGVGALLRYLVAGWGQQLSSGLFPLGTLLVNVIGCLLIGMFGAVFAGPHLINEHVRVALLVGFLGAFTTFSTFGWETFSLADDGQFKWVAVNMLLNNGLGLIAVWFGYRITAALVGGS